MDDLDQPIRSIGEEWEAQMIGALRLRYQSGAMLSVLPAEMQGDGGLEAFSHDGLGFQCYADRDSITKRDRLKKQMAKINTDTFKLKKNIAVLTGRLGGVRLKRWVLLVPEYNAAALVDHCNKRAGVVIGWNLGIVDPEDFRIVVQTEDDYRIELDTLFVSGVAKVVVPTSEPDEVAVAGVSDDAPDLVSVLDGKLTNVVSDPVRVRNDLLRAYLLKGQVMQGFADWPESYEAIESIRREYEERVASESNFNPYNGQRISDLIRTLTDTLKREVPSLDPSQAHQIAEGAVTEWLMRCPLRPLAES